MLRKATGGIARIGTLLTRTPLTSWRARKVRVIMAMVQSHHIPIVARVERARVRMARAARALEARAQPITPAQLRREHATSVGQQVILHLTVPTTQQTQPNKIAHQGRKDGIIRRQYQLGSQQHHILQNSLTQLKQMWISCACWN